MFEKIARYAAGEREVEVEVKEEVATSALRVYQV